MTILKKAVAVMSILLAAHMGLASVLLADTSASKGLTTHSPEVWTTSEEKIPVEIVEKKTSKWVWIGLGALLLAGGAAAAAGGGGGGGDDPSEPAPSQNGDVTVTW